MTDNKTLNLLLEFVQNPVIIKQFAFLKFNREEYLEMAKGDAYLVDCMNDLERTVEEALRHLTELGIPAARIATSYLFRSDKLN